jgi:hemoglobin
MVTLQHGITREQIDALVDRFYAKVREDAQIGPVFDAAIDDWPSHLELLKGFWATVLLGAGEYTGNPMAKHLMLPLEPAHFRRWLALFAETAGEVMAPDDAQVVIAKSQLIARNFQAAMGIAWG